MDRVEYIEIQCKSALNRAQGMPFKWSLNPYTGCTHGSRQEFADVLNGALLYAPAFILLLALGVFHARHWAAVRFSLLAAAGVFAIALVFRTLDQEVCPALPIGTHFLWHSLTGLAAYLAMRCLILSRASRVGLGVESGFQRA
jgi:hypothetical protein